MSLQTALRGTVATIAVPIALSATLEVEQDGGNWRAKSEYGDVRTSQTIDLGEILRLIPILGPTGGATTSETAIITEPTATNAAPDVANSKATEDAAIAWLSKPLAQIVELARSPTAELPGEQAIRRTSIASAVATLLDLQDVEGPQPQVIARGDGGLQLVWYTPKRDLEVEVSTNGKLEIVEFDGQKTHRIAYGSDAAATALRRIREALKT